MRISAVVSGAGVCAVLATVGCGGGSTSAPSAPPTPVPTRAEVTVTVSPPTLVAQVNNDRTYPWRVDWTLVLRETAGVGGNVNDVSVGSVNSFRFETPTGLNYGAD
jgi:hypothetical protein